MQDKERRHECHQTRYNIQQSWLFTCILNGGICRSRQQDSFHTDFLLGRITAYFIRFCKHFLSLKNWWHDCPQSQRLRLFSCHHNFSFLSSVFRTIILFLGSV